MADTHEFLDHTADVLFQATADTLPGLFVQSALAVEGTMTNLDQFEEKEMREITGKSKKIDLLLFDFLDDLLFYKDSELIIFKRFEIKIDEKKDENGEIIYHLSCKAYGEPFDHDRHERTVDVKAITLHMFEVRHKNDKWFSQVLIDI